MIIHVTEWKKKLAAIEPTYNKLLEKQSIRVINVQLGSSLDTAKTPDPK
jgi:hypothetical protein